MPDHNRMLFNAVKVGCGVLLYMSVVACATMARSGPSERAPVATPSGRLARQDEMIGRFGPLWESPEARYLRVDLRPLSHRSRTRTLAVCVGRARVVKQGNGVREPEYVFEPVVVARLSRREAQRLSAFLRQMLYRANRFRTARSPGRDRRAVFKGGQHLTVRYSDREYGGLLFSMTVGNREQRQIDFYGLFQLEHFKRKIDEGIHAMEMPP